MLDMALRLGFDELNDDINVVLSQYQKVKHDFYRAFDPSLVTSFLNDQLSNAYYRAPNAELLGEGNHFRVYKLKLSSNMALAVSCAKPKFLKQLPAQKRSWVSMMKAVQGINHVLIPPMELFETEDQLAYIQPCCTGEIFLLNKAYLSKLSQSLDRVLYEHQLRLIDGQQILAHEGLAFVVDWSDLTSIR